MSSDNGNGERKRWYDSTRIIWSLFALVGVLVGILCSILLAQVDGTKGELGSVQAVNAAQEVKIQKLDTTLGGVEAQQKRMETSQDRLIDKLDKYQTSTTEKMDKILERLPPR